MKGVSESAPDVGAASGGVDGDSMLSAGWATASVQSKLKGWLRPSCLVWAGPLMGHGAEVGAVSWTEETMSQALGMGCAFSGVKYCNCLSCVLKGALKWQLEGQKHIPSLGSGSMILWIAGLLVSAVTAQGLASLRSRFARVYLELNEPGATLGMCGRCHPN